MAQSFEVMLYYTHMTSDQNQKITKELSQKLKEAREKSDMTQAEVANKAGMDVTYYARIERGEINTSYDKLRKIAEVLKTKLL
mgnify:CR=1 FL=1